jgi:hypothetical protein
VHLETLISAFFEQPQAMKENIWAIFLSIRHALADLFGCISKKMEEV